MTIKQAKRKQKIRKRNRIILILDLSMIISLIIFTVGMNIIFEHIGWGLVLVLPTFSWMVFLIIMSFLTVED